MTDGVIRLRLDTKAVERSASELAADLRKQLGSIRVNGKILDLSDATKEAQQLTRELLKAQAALADGTESVELQKQLALLDEALRYRRQLASIEGMGLDESDAQIARSLAAELNSIRLDQINSDFDLLADRARAATDEARKLAEETARIQADRSFDRLRALNAQALRAQAGATEGRDSVELQRQAALIEQQLRLERELASIDTKFISADEVVRARELREQVNAIEVDRINRQFDELNRKTAEAAESTRRMAEETARATAEGNADRLRALQAQVLRAQGEAGSFSNPRDNVELQRTAALIEEALRFKQQLAAIENSGFTEAEVARAREFAAELNRVNVDRLNSQFDEFSRVAGDRLRVVKQALGGLVENIQRGIGQQLGEQIFSSIAFGLTQIPAAIGAATLEIEKFGTVLRQAIGDDAVAAGVLQELRDFADTTPFQIAEVTEAYVKLQNRALNPSVELLRSLGDIAASQGKSLQQANEAFLDATQGQFRRLEELGIGASSSGDKVTFTFKGVTTTVENTAVAIRGALEEFARLPGIAGSIEELGNTLGGQLSTLQDNVKGLAADFGNELTPVILEVVRAFNENADGIKDFAQSAGQFTGDVLQLLINALKLAADNGTLLADITAILIIRFTALKAIAIGAAIANLTNAFIAANVGAVAFAATLKSSNLALLTLTASTKTASLGLFGVAAAGKAAIVALAPLAIQLAAIAAAYKGIEFAIFANQLAEGNTAIAGLSAEVQASSEAAFAAANRTSNAIDKINAARAKGRGLNAEELDDAKKLAAANDLRLQQLQQTLEFAERIPVAEGDEQQRNAKEGLIQTTRTSIEALRRENDELKTAAGLKKDDAALTANQDAAIKRINDTRQKALDTLELEEARRQAIVAQSLAQGTITEEQAAERILEIDRDTIVQRINIAEKAAADLRKIRTTNPAEQEKINREILEKEQEAAKAQLDLARNTAAQQRQILEGITQESERTLNARSASDSERIAQIRNAINDGAVDEEEGQRQILAIQRQTSEQTIALKQREIARINQERLAGEITEEQAADRTIALRREVAEASIAIAENEAQRRQQLLAEIAESTQDAEREIALNLRNEQNAIQDALLGGDIGEDEARRRSIDLAIQGSQERIAVAQDEIDRTRAFFASGEIDREEAERRIIEAQSRAAQERGNITEQEFNRRRQILEDFRRAAQQAEDEIALAQARGEAQISQDLADGLIEAEQAQRQREDLAADGFRDRLADNRQEIEDNRRALQQGLIDRETFQEEELRLSRERYEILDQQADQALDRDRRRSADRIRLLEQEAQIVNDRRNLNLDAESRALTRENGLLEAQFELLQARNAVEEEQLRTQITRAEQSGNTAQSALLQEQLKQEEFQNQEELLQRQLELQTRQLDITQRQRRIESERSQIQAEDQVLADRRALTQAEANDASEQELANLRESIELSERRLELAQAVVASLSEVERLERENLQATQQASREKLEQQRIQEQQRKTQQQITGSTQRQAAAQREVTQEVDRTNQSIERQRTALESSQQSFQSALVPPPSLFSTYQRAFVQDALTPLIDSARRGGQQIGEALSPSGGFSFTAPSIDSSGVNESIQQTESIAQSSLDRLSRSVSAASGAIELAQSRRVASVRQAVLSGAIDEEEAQDRIAAIQEASARQAVAIKRRELVQIRALRSQGAISAQEAADREASIQQELAQANLDRIEAEIAAQERLKDAAVRAIEEQFRVAEQRLSQYSNTVDLQTSALSAQRDLLSAQVDLQTSLNSLAQEQTNTQIAIAEAAGRTAEAEQLKRHLLQQQAQQLTAQFAAQREQFQIQVQLRAIEIQKEQIAARIALLEAQAAVRQAQARGASAEELEALQAVVGLRNQQLSFANQAGDRQRQLNQLNAQNLTTQQQIEAERFRQQSIQQLGRSTQQLGNETGKTTEALGGFVDAIDRATAAVGGTGRLQARRKGGEVRAGEPYLVGEEGAELIVPRRNGFVLTAEQTAELLGRSIGGIGIAAPKEVQRSNDRLLAEIRGLRSDLRNQQPTQNNNFTLVNPKEDTTDQVLRINRGLMRQQLRRQGR